MRRRELSRVPVFAPIRAYVDGLVHPAARADALTAARHRAFLAANIAAGLLALAALPIFLAIRGAPGGVEVAAFAWLATPLALAWLLAATGRLALAHILSAASQSGLAVTVAAATGGTSSFALVWLALVPFEAALCASRRVVGAATAIAVAAGLLLVAADTAGLLPPARDTLLGNDAMLVAALAATVYAAGLALAAGALARTGERLKLHGDTRYRMLAEHMTDLITRHSANGTVTFVSPASETLLGVSPADVAAQGLFARVHVADRPAYLTALARTASEGVDTTVEFRLRRGPLAGAADPRGDAGHVWVEMRAHALDGTAADGRHDIVAVTRDIAERKRGEAALEAARGEAERANLAKSRFLATMSHELRTPLNAIIGFAEMLTNEGELRLDAARRGDYARLIHDSGQHLLAVVNSVIDVSRIESGNFDIVPEPCRLGAIVESCRAMMALKAEAGGLTLDMRLAPDLPEITADKRALKQIVINLVSNAIKFTKPGGRVRIEAWQQAGDVVVQVADTGIGIEAENLPRLGDPFFQAHAAYDRPYEGTGLGLSVVKGLVALHGGTLEIASRVGEGTTVTMRLPRDCETRREGEVIPALPRRAGLLREANQRPSAERTGEARKRA